MKILKKLLAVVGILVLIVGAGVLWLLNRGGAFTEIKPHFAGSCEALPLEGSGEDIVIDRERGIAYLSVLDRRSVAQGKDVQGTVMRLDLNVRPFQAVDALLTKPGPMRPHGLSLYIGPDGSRRLFVINHGPKRGADEAVEIFTESAPGEYVHAETVRGPQLTSPNDLVAVGPQQFYVANDKPVGGGIAAALQQVGIGASPLSYFDGANGRFLLEDNASGGGINVSLDGNTLYVAETAGKRLRVLARQADGSVVDQMRIPMNTSPDNIDVAADGSVWVTGHANTLALVKHFVSGAPAPAQVWRVVVGSDPASATQEEVYLDDGTQMSAGSVGATWNRWLLVGSITERKIQLCERAG